MEQAENFLQQKLDERLENGLLRKLTTTSLPSDFCSNDYLGFAKSWELKNLIAEKTETIIEPANGSGGSRLLSGNHWFTEETEQLVANFHQAASGLIFNSGYDANVGLLSSIPQRGDTIITDELIHASIIDGARLSYAERFKFRHNDVVDLEAKLKNAKGIVYVIVESVYSMDGDIAPLLSICLLCRQYNANLIVDEAHATGIFGENGKGLVAALNLETQIFARIVTFGKAMGAHGAIVLGSNALRSYLINFCRSFIYTTAAPIHNILAIHCAYLHLAAQDLSIIIREKIALYNTLIANSGLSVIESESAIQTILVPGNQQARAAAAQLQAKGLDVRPILSPTVAIGQERLRICLHLYNPDQEIERLVNELKSFA